jgi:serine-type D-Ala-D-Ala carboxypeptidase/endopeptidase (penicillin-binding protein 4)
MEANGSQKTAALLSHQATTSINPASLSKLATTVAALDLLGPTFVWRTPVYIDGPVRDGVLQGNVYVRGSGDPRLVVERVWLLMRRLQGLGIQKIQGDIVLDRSAFDLLERNPASFDGEPLRPYNASPEALLVNFKSLVFQFMSRSCRQCGAHSRRAAIGWRAISSNCAVLQCRLQRLPQQLAR